MKRLVGHTWSWPLLIGGLLILGPALAAGQSFTSGSTGADGAFAPTCTPTPCTVWVQVPASGVFNFTTVTVPVGVTVRFTRNATNSPAVLLATGAVTIDGTLEVSGYDAGVYGRPGSGGPGGFDGGAGADYVTTLVGGAGLGPGGGGGGSATQAGSGGGFGTAGGGTSGGTTYGSPVLRPMLGGSGGGGGGTNAALTGGGGGGGGGALLLASSGTVTLAGHLDGGGNWIPAIRANGGSGGSGYWNGGGGSGGAVRIVAQTIAGNAPVRATSPYASTGAGGNGRIRLEAYNLTHTGATTPFTITSYPQAVFPAAGQPTLGIASVGGIAPPAAPKGNYLDAPDVVLPSTISNPVEVALAASNLPLGTVIQVTVTPQSGSRSTVNSTGLAGSIASSTATASITLLTTQTSILTATATYPLVASAGEGPLFADGEEVTHVKVAAVFGAPSTLTYLTRSGREVQVQ
jgi:hypothetical protein